MNDRLKLQHLSLRKANGRESKKCGKNIKARQQLQVSKIGLPQAIQHQLNNILSSVQSLLTSNNTTMLHDIDSYLQLFINSKTISDQIKSFQLFLRISWNKIDCIPKQSRIKLIDNLFIVCLQLCSLPFPKDFIKVS